MDVGYAGLTWKGKIFLDFLFRVMIVAFFC